MILPTLFMVSELIRSDKGLAADGVADPQPETRPKPDPFLQGPAQPSALAGVLSAGVRYRDALVLHRGHAEQPGACSSAMNCNSATPAPRRIYSSFFVAAIIGKVLFGYLADKFDKLKVT